MLQFSPDADLDRELFDPEPGDDFEGQALASFRAACADLLACGWSETELANEIENCLPWAVEIDESAPAIAPPF